MAKEVVWALFDSETCTVAKALPECVVYSFGKGSGTEHIDLDLSDFETAKKALDNYPKPDVIFASPPCESWTNANASHKAKFTKQKGLNLHWQSKWIGFDFLHRFKEKRLNGINCTKTLAKIIQHYSPAYFAVENPAISLIFDYLREKCNLTGYKNLTNYYSYGLIYLKKTIILSNLKLDLKNLIPDRKLAEVSGGGNKKRNAKLKKYGLEFLSRKYKDRSLVPPALYQDIMRQFRHGGQPVLFSDSDYKVKEAV